MNQITAFRRSQPAVLTSIILLHAVLAESPPASSPDSAEKDNVLEELQLSAQGIFTDSKPSAGEENQNPPTTPPPKQTLLEGLQAVKQQRQKEYMQAPSRVKKEELEKKLNKIISSDPKNEEAHWELFELYHHYIEWSQNTDFYEEGQPFQILKLLQDIHKRFGESPKISKYLCQYSVANHLYVESQTHCEKAKKLLPEDTNLHIYADYFLSFPDHNLNQGPQKNHRTRPQILLNLLKTKPPTEKLYTAIGTLFADKKKYDLSMKYFKKAVKMNDSYIPGLLGLAQVLTKSEQHETALKYYILSCQKHPYRSRTPFQQAKAHLSRQSLFKWAGEYQKQINICVNSIKISG